MTEDPVTKVVPQEAAALTKELSDEERGLDEILLVLLRRGFEAREAGSLKGWH